MSKEIRIYSLTKENFKDLNTDRLEANVDAMTQTINMADTFFMKAYMQYKRASDIDFTDAIVKVFIPTQRAKEMLLDGFYMNDSKYIAYTSTPSLQKKEDGSHKTEFIFIREDEKDFIDWFETGISLGKFKEKFTNNSDPIAINKQVTSRTGLAFSNVTKINSFKPRIIIVKNHEYEHLAKVDLVATEGKGRDREIILEDGKPKLLLNQERVIEHEANDGMGLMSPATAEAIKQSMELEYDVFFSVIRMFNGLAVKGLCMTFDYVSYLEEHNKACKGKYGCYTVVDAYDNEQDIRECDLLLTTSQAKWWKNFNSTEEVNERLAKVRHDSMKEMLSSLYVARVNKNPQELPSYTMSNYQLIGNLDISFEQYKELAKPTHDLYKGVREGDMNSIKILLKDFANMSTFMNEDSEIEIEKEIILNDDIQASTVTEALLNVNSDFYQMKRVKQSLYSLVTQKIYNLMSGRCAISGCYTYIAQDPIAMLNRLIGAGSEGELGENEFYCEGIEKEYVIQRNPCNCFNEIVKIKTTTNPVYDKWLGHIGREMIIFNAKDSTNTRLSGADFDGDACLVTDEPIILDTVIQSDTFFINEDDGATETATYNHENKIKALYSTGGNSIGTLANLGAKLSNDSHNDKRKHLPYLYTTLLMQQISIDSVKTMITVPEQMKEVLESEEIKAIKKPYFMRYRSYVKNQNVYNNEEYIDFNSVQSTLDRYAQYCTQTLIAPYKKPDGSTGSDLLLLSMVMPQREVNQDLAQQITDLYLEKKEKLKKLNKVYRSHEVAGALLSQKDYYEQKAKELRQAIKERVEFLNFPGHINEEDKKELQDQIYELEIEKKKAHYKVREVTEQLKPYLTKKKAYEALIKAEIQCKCLALTSQYEEEDIIRALHANRTDKEKKYSPAFLIDNFFDLMLKYMKVQNAYKLTKVDEDGDFSYLGEQYKKVHRDLKDSHIVVQSILANMNKVAKVKSLGIRSAKESLGLSDTTIKKLEDYNYLKNKPLKLKMGEKYLEVYLDNVKIGWLFKNDIQGVNMQTVEEITIIDIELPNKYTGKSIYIYFMM